jgi:hypothetical protein
MLMKSCYIAALSMLAGAGIGAGTLHALHARKIGEKYATYNVIAVEGVTAQ